MRGQSAGSLSTHALLVAYSHYIDTCVSQEASFSLHTEVDTPEAARKLFTFIVWKELFVVNVWCFVVV